MKQFVTSNIIASEMMVPGLFTKEQFFAMCEELRKLSFYGKVIFEVRLKIESSGSDAVGADIYDGYVMDKIKQLLIEVGEKDIPGVKILEIYNECIKIRTCKDDTIKALNSIYPVMGMWQSKEIDDLIKYYKIVLDKFSALECVLPKYLYHDVIKEGLKKICKDMELIRGKIIHSNVIGGDDANTGAKKDLMILLYPEGLVNAEYYYSLHKHVNESIFKTLAMINPGRYREPDDDAYTDATLAKELLARKFLEEGKYICEGGSITFPDDNENDCEYEMPMYEELYVYCSSDDKEMMLGKELERILESIRKEIKIVTDNIGGVFGVNLKIDTTKDLQQKKESIIAKRIFHRYSRFFIETNKGMENITKKRKKDIFRVLKSPSYENSISGLMTNSTENGKMMFCAKSDLLKSSLKNKELHDKMLRIDENVPLPYLFFVESVEKLKKLFRFDGLTARAAYDMDRELFISLSEKREMMHRLKMEFYNIYSGCYEEDEKIGKLEQIYFKMVEHEYIGIIRDIKLMYINLEKWLSKIPKESVEYLLDKQMRIDDGELATRDFDFKKEIRKYRRDIATIIGTDDIESSCKEIYRYADRYYDMWATMLELYPKKKWGQNNFSYADLGTMVALVQVEAMLRKKKIKFQYKYSYKSDAGKNVTLSNYRNAYLDKMISRHVVMDLLSWQILCNFGFGKSVKKAFKIIIRLCKVYEELYMENRFHCFAERAQGLEFDANLFTNMEIENIHHKLRKYCADSYNDARREKRT
ncbi:hypothetical protein [Selenomonas sp. AB3002]|uniref:hypothetical protein n=1 Tax=Selenomonas sp. AB3002 TaxID=1392502 RepID=UPI0004963DBD